MSSSCRWGWKEQVRVPACDPGGNIPKFPKRVHALRLLETWMNSGSAHLKGTSPCPRREDTLGLHPVGQEAFPCLPDCSQTASFALLLCSSWTCSPFPPCHRSVLCPPAPRGPPLPPSLLPLALRAGARSHTRLCDSMGCQESSVWHVL